MKMPSKLSTWIVVLFFLVFGLAQFVAAANIPLLIGILALGAAVTLFMDR